MDFSNYIFRSHMVGNIISVEKPLTENQFNLLTAYSERKSGNGKPLTAKQEKEFISLLNKHNEAGTCHLTEGAKKLLSNMVFYEKTGRIKILENQYLEKGIKCEKQARDLISSVLGIFLTEDDERKKNEWVTGKRDIKNNTVIPDIKAKYDFESFCNCLVDSTSEIYLRQLDCYMELWNVSDSVLCHVLVDTPFNLINNELRKKGYKNDIFNEHGDLKEESIPEAKAIICNHIYTREGLEKFCNESPNIYIEWFDDFVEIPAKDRIHMIPHSYQKERIEQRNESIRLAREYMNTVKPINNIIEINES